MRYTNIAMLFAECKVNRSKCADIQLHFNGAHYYLGSFRLKGNPLRIEMGENAVQQYGDVRSGLELVSKL